MKHPLLRLYAYSFNYRKDIILAFIFSILNKLLDLAPPVLIGAAVDIVVRKNNSIFSDFGIIELDKQLYALAILTFLIWFGESLFEYLYKVKWRNLAQTIQHQMRMDGYNHIQHLDLEFFEDRQTGGLMAILNNDINQLERFLDTGANDLIQVTTTVIAIMTMFFLLNPEIALLALIPIPLIIIFSFKFQKSLESRYKNMREKVSILNGRLSNNLSGIATIKSFTNEDLELKRIEDASLMYRDANRSVIKFSSAFSPLIRMIIVGGFLAMLIVGGFKTLNGEINVATYSVIIFLIQRLLWPLTRLGDTFDQYQRAMASTNRALNLLDTPAKITSGNLLPAKNGAEIIVSKLFFSYKTRKNVLKDININIPSGKTIAFVGPTGSGKSTIVKLLLRFYDPTSGTIKYNGTDIRELQIDKYRKLIGFVPQDTFLIDGTIKENILYGNPKASMNEVINAAEIAEIHSFITTLDEGYDTLVGERGKKLSGGQKQRISIARAVLKNPPILIFDEATSSVDNETEAAIQRSLELITKNRTTIIIAHRLSTIRHADMIYVLENGRIIESGVHDELVSLNGRYATLWKVQTGEKIIQKI